MKIAAIVEARMASKRLPGKVLFEAKNITMLDHLVDRLKKVKIIDEIIVATTINPIDQEIIDFCEAREIKYFRYECGNRGCCKSLFEKRKF